MSDDRFTSPTQPTGAPESSSRASRLSRRAVIATAAWATPAVVMMATAPTSTASGAPVMEFDKSIYSSSACSTLSGVVLTVRVNGAPAAGRLMTVSLSQAYTFSDGSHSSTGLTGSDGRLEVPAIHIPPGGGIGTITASTDASTPVSATLSAFNLIGSSADNNRFPATPTSVRVTSIVADNRTNLETVFFLGSDEKVYRSRNAGAWETVSTGEVKLLTKAVGLNATAYVTSDSFVFLTPYAASFPLPAGVEVASCVVLPEAWVILDRNGDVYAFGAAQEWQQLPVSDVDMIAGAVNKYVVCRSGASLRNVTTTTGDVVDYPALPDGVGVVEVAASTTTALQVNTYVKGSDSRLYFHTTATPGQWTRITSEAIDSLYAGLRGFTVYSVGGTVYLRDSGGFTVALQALPSGVTVNGLTFGDEPSQIFARASDGYLYQWTVTGGTQSQLQVASPYDVETFFASADGRGYYGLRPGC